ncbi:hypothetical protein BDD12DRAFT_812313 [Trichophaea hybrida]|nr:hypothetical protein BDD12DRAFT_812313 [Trichophaea hybrida]
MMEMMDGSLFYFFLFFNLYVAPSPPFFSFYSSCMATDKGLVFVLLHLGGILFSEPKVCIYIPRRTYICLPSLPVPPPPYPCPDYFFPSFIVALREGIER